MVPRAPDSQLESHSNPLSDALFRYQFIHIQAYVVHIDLVLSHEIAFKLTPESIASLVEYHKAIYMIDQTESTWHWTEKDAAVKTMHEDFVQMANKYVFRTDKIALEGIEDDGSGELLCGQSEEVKNAVLGFFLPLLPPPPRVVEVRAPMTPTIPSSPGAGGWWAPTPPIHGQIAPVESWKVLPSSIPASTASPSPVSISSASLPNIWAMNELQGNATYGGNDLGVSSSMMMSTAGQQAPLMAASSSWWNNPHSSPEMMHQQMPFLTTSASLIPQLPLPSLLAPSCGTSMGFGGFGWDTGRFADYATTM
jgi:hypothetical protein